MAPRKPAGQALAQGIAAIGLQQLFARLIPFFLHTVANNYISPEDASVRNKPAPPEATNLRIGTGWTLH